MNPQPPVASPAIAEKERSRNRILMAVMLQCIPLIAAAGCASQGATNQSSGLGPLLWLAALFWGFGYLYLQRMWRFIVLLLIGPVFTVTSCTASYHGVTYDYEHSYTYNNDPQRLKTDVATANRFSFQEALIIAAPTLLLAVDAWRLAALDNARLDRLPQPAEPPVAPPAPEAAEPAEEKD